MESAVFIRGLTKRYPETTALAEVSFEVPASEIFGVIGPNGAGKTTLFKILATLVRPESGTALIGGYDVIRDRSEVRRLLGYMPDQFGLFENLTVGEYLDFFAAAYQVPVGERDRVIGDILELTDLGAKQNDPTRGLSRGVQQRLCLARALVHDPQVLVLDEPAANLDPRARIELRAIIRTLAGMGKTILISSHILTELSDICTAVAILEQGRLVAAGKVAELLGALRPQLGLRILPGSDPDQCLAVLAGLANVTEARREGPLVRAVWLGPPDEVNTVVSALIQAGVAVAEFAVEESDLEDAFMALTEGKVQ